MDDTQKTKDELITELNQLKAQLAEQDSSSYDHRFAEEALQRSEKRFHQLSNASIEAIIITKGGYCYEANQTAADMFGFSDPADLLGAYFTDVIAPDSHLVVQENYITDSTHPYEAFGQKRDNTTFPIEIRTKKIPYNDSESLIVMSIRDTSDLKKAERRFRLASEITSDLIYEWDVADNSMEWFGDVDKALGFNPRELPRTIEAWIERIHPDDQHRMINSFELQKREGKPVFDHYRIAQKNGLWRFWTDRSIPIICKEGVPVRWIGVCTDITKQKEAEFAKIEMETQLRQSQKMEAIGALAGGVAHDMNNILAAILNSATALELESELLESSEDITNIVTACRRGRDLTRDLLGFARKGKYVKRRLSLNRIVNDALNFLSRTISKQVYIETNLGKDLKHIEGDCAQIEHALMNICINASDAMPKGGTITITTENAEFDTTTMFQSGELPTGSYIKLTITDTGVGMDNNTVERAFEPFFTTKSKGKGTGLGLSMVYGVVKNHDGGLKINSEPEKGTSIVIYLPAIERFNSSLPAPTFLKEYESTHDSFKILLVDDEPLVLNSAKRVLEKLGYEVIAIEDGKRAVDLFRQDKQNFALILLDMIMPHMDGSETFRRLKEIDPKIKVLICSGYSKDDRVEELLTKGAHGFLQKPFDIDVLSEMIKNSINDYPSTR